MGVLKSVVLLEGDVLLGVVVRPKVATRWNAFLWCFDASLFPGFSRRYGVEFLKNNECFYEQNQKSVLHFMIKIVCLKFV